MENAYADPALASHPAATVFPTIGSYLGVPLVLADDTLFGTLCVVDPEPRTFPPEQVGFLVVLARLLATQIERDRELEERRRVEAEIAAALQVQSAANAELERLNKVKSDFVSVVSHEFRTPLTSIRGFSELIRDRDLERSDVKAFADEINQNACRLSRMIDEMLDLDRMHSGQITVRRQPCDLNALISDVADSLRPTAPEHVIHLHLDPALPPIVGDSDRLTQVITNLLANAIKYAPDGGTITGVSRQEGDAVHLAVQDDGIGIAPEALEAIFERYARVEADTGAPIPGTGLGLPIVREIVGLHGGQVWAESRVGRGSVFHVVLPLVPGNGLAHGASVEPSPAWWASWNRDHP
ncbi:MAG: GAF domain-containing sensor histidine kinase [Chloroflexota bacterium]|nr:GAF domain-containing sensor histidine kinase [Chloroflexota bacterium]